MKVKLRCTKVLLVCIYKRVYQVNEKETQMSKWKGFFFSFSSDLFDASAQIIKFSPTHKYSVASKLRTHKIHLLGSPILVRPDIFNEDARIENLQSINDLPHCPCRKKRSFLLLFDIQASLYELASEASQLGIDQFFIWSEGSSTSFSTKSQSCSFWNTVCTLFDPCLQSVACKMFKRLHHFTVDSLILITSFTLTSFYKYIVRTRETEHTQIREKKRYKL